MQETVKPDHMLLTEQASGQVQGGPYSEITINMDEGTNITGIQFVCPPGHEETVLEEMCKNLRFPVTITMPCGYSHTCDAPISLMRDIPCLCRRPEHWIVKWEISRGVEK